MMKMIHIALIATLALGVAGCEVRKPGSFENRVAVMIKQNITVGGKDWKNPTADSPDVIKAGGEHFQHRCQACHGYDGQATGVPFESQLYPPIPDLSSPDIQGYSDGQLKSIIENGISPSGMPAWRGIIDDNTMWKIVRYIRHLPPKGSLGAPDVYLEAAEAPQTAGKESQPTFRFSEKDRQGLSAVQVLFVTVDPERDTPSLLAQYVPAFNPTFLGLYGSDDETARTAREFKIVYEKQGEDPNYAVDHSAGTYVYDPSGRLRLFVRHGHGADVFVHDIQALLNDHG